MAATRADNVVHHRKAEPCSFIFALGGEERFEDSALRIAVHADASIGHPQHHIISARQRGGPASARRFRSDVRGFQRQLSALRHGVAGVDHEIHDDLLDLSGIGTDTTSIRFELDHELHFIAQHSEKHLAHAIDQGIEVEHLWAEYMLPAEGKQLPCQAGCTLRGADDGFYILAHGRSRAVFLHHDFRVSANDHEQVVEVVCNPARQPADRLHLLRLPNLLLERAPSGDIARGDHDAAHRHIVQQIVAYGFQPDPRSILATKTILWRRGASDIEREAFQRRPHCGRIVGVDEGEKTLSQKLRRLVSRDPFERRAVVKHGAVDCDDRNHVREILNQVTKTLLAAPQNRSCFQAVADITKNAKDRGPSIQLSRAGADFDWYQSSIGAKQFQFSAARSPIGGGSQQLPPGFVPFGGIELRFGFAYEFFLRNSEDLAGLVVGFQNEASLRVDDQNRIVRGIDQVAIFLFGVADLLKEGGGQGNPDQQQQTAGQNADHGNHTIDPTSPFAQGRGEFVLEWSHARIAARHFFGDGPYFLCVGMGGVDLAMELIRQRAKLIYVAIALGPNGNGSRHVANASKPAEEQRHAVHVFRTVAPLQKAVTNYRHVGRRTFQFEPSLLVACRHRDFSQVLLVVAFCGASGVFGQAEDGAFFCLRPQALPTDVSANSGEHLGTEHTQEKHADHNGDENANNHSQLTGNRKAAEHFSLKSHARRWPGDQQIWRNTNFRARTGGRNSKRGNFVRL